AGAGRPAGRPHRGRPGHRERVRRAGVAADAGHHVSAARLGVVVADDQALVRAGFRMILQSQPDIMVVAEAGDGDEAGAACRRHRPSVVLMDVRMPNLDGIEATRRVASMGGNAPKVLILTTFDLDEYVYRALRAGASGFLLKDVRPEHLIAAVRQVVDGD